MVFEFFSRVDPGPARSGLLKLENYLNFSAGGDAPPRRRPAAPACWSVAAAQLGGATGQVQVGRLAAEPASEREATLYDWPAMCRVG